MRTNFLSFIICFHFSALSFADPVIVKIENYRKQDLFITEPAPPAPDPMGMGPDQPVSLGRSFTISKNGGALDVVVTDKSDFSVRYQSGEAAGRLFWQIDEKLDSVIARCQAKSKNWDRFLHICVFELGQQSKKTGLLYSTYELTLKEAISTPIQKDDFTTVLSHFSPKTSLFYPDSGLATHDDARRFIDTYARYLESAKPYEGKLKTVDLLEKSAEFYLSYLKRLPGRAPALREPSHQQILFIGDQGTGKEHAVHVARDMYAICFLKGCDYGISAGDNIYPYGPSIKDKDWEKEFIKKFVDIYKPIWNKFKFPFYMTLGNHDVGIHSWVFSDRRPILGRDATHYRTKRIPLMEAQVAFTKHPSNPADGQKMMWNMPDNEYAKVIDEEGIKTAIISLNTNTFPGIIGPNGEPWDLPHRVDLQKNWLVSQLRKDDFKNADWRVVFGHHALYSIGRHGVIVGTGLGGSDVDDMMELRQELLPVLCSNNVDLYLVGHDHHLQVDEIKCPDGRIILQVLSGAAAKMESESPWGDVVIGLPLKITGSLTGRVSNYAFTANALYDQFLWANSLDRDDIMFGKPVRPMLGFSFITLDKKSAVVEMIESTEEGPELLACFTLERGEREVSGGKCEPGQDFSKLFLKNLPIIGGP